MARIYTLPVLMLVIAIYNIFPTVMPSDGWFNNNLWIGWGVVNFVLTIPYLFWYTWQLETGRSFVYFRRGTAREDFLAQHGTQVRELIAFADSLDAATDTHGHKTRAPAAD